MPRITAIRDRPASKTIEDGAVVRLRHCLHRRCDFNRLTFCIGVVGLDVDALDHVEALYVDVPPALFGSLIDDFGLLKVLQLGCRHGPPDPNAGVVEDVGVQNVVRLLGGKPLGNTTGLGYGVRHYCLVDTPLSLIRLVDLDGDQWGIVCERNILPAFCGSPYFCVNRLWSEGITTSDEMP